MDHGRMREFSQADLVCSHYLAFGSIAAARREWHETSAAPGNEWVRLESVEIQSGGKTVENVEIKMPVEICISYRVLQNGKVLIPNIHLHSEDGALIFISHDWYSGWRTQAKPAGCYRTTFTVPGNFFSEGRVTVKVAISTYQPFEVHLEEPDAVAFTVVESSDGNTSRGDYAGHLPGIIRPLIPTRTEVLGS
jgi:lipopolysaccharide transport system ATP-binding protein